MGHPARRHHRHTIVAAALGVFGVNPYQVDKLTQITLASNIGTFLVYGGTWIIYEASFGEASGSSRTLLSCWR